MQLKLMSVTAAGSVLQLSHAALAFHAGRGKPGNPSGQHCSAAKSIGSKLLSREVPRIKTALQENPSDQNCSAGKSIGSILLSREIHRIKDAQQRRPPDQGCSAERSIGSRLLRSIGSRLLSRNVPRIEIAQRGNPIAQPALQPRILRAKAASQGPQAEDLLPATGKCTGSVLQLRMFLVDGEKQRQCKGPESVL